MKGKIIYNPILQNMLNPLVLETYVEGNRTLKDSIKIPEVIGIQSIEYIRTNPSGDNVYSIKLTNGLSYEIIAPKGDAGVGVLSVKFTRTESNGDRVYTIKLDNGNDFEFVCPKGSPGTTNYNELENKPFLPTKVSELQNDSGYTTSQQVQQQIANLVNSAPQTLDTLKELADALNNDPNFATTIATQISQKYTKPQSGIPASDLSDAVQNSLNKADTSQPLLVSGTNIKTINNQSLLGNGNLDINGGISSWDEIEDKPDLATVATSGSYNDLSNKPTIPDAQIQSDWNQATTTAKDYIKNKPTIPDVTEKADKVSSATNGNLAGLNASGNLTDSGVALNSLVFRGEASGSAASVSFDPQADTVHTTAQTLDNTQKEQARANIGIPEMNLVYQGANQGTVSSISFNPETDTVHVTVQTLSAAQQLQARTNIGAGTSSFSGSYNDLTNKPTIPDTTNFVQKSQTSGLLKNDGTVDTNIYLTSHQDISGKADKVVGVDASTLPSTLDPNKVYQMGTLTGSVTIPAFSAVASGDTEAKIWCFTFNTSTTAPTITWPAAITNWVGGSAPTINASKKYEVTVMNGIGAIMEA